MNRFSLIRDHIITIVRHMQAEGLLTATLPLEAVDVMPPREASHGDMATNAAMVLAAKAGMSARTLAEMLVQRFQALPDIHSVEIAGPGFINLRFAPVFWQRLVGEMLQAGIEYGKSTIGNGQKINVEYVSANPTGPMHVGHGRGAVVGDALARLLARAGFHVTKEYYINDAGAQVDVLARSAYLRYREACGEAIGEIPEGFYPGDYLIPLGQALKASHGTTLLGQPESVWLPVVREAAIAAMMALIRADLAQLGIHHDVFTSERALTQSGAIDRCLALLESKGLIYTGVLEPPKGKTPEDWEPRPQTLFKSTAFGDDIDRPIKKSDGSWTYFAPDIACHYDKIQRGHLRMVNIFGADHGGYAKRIQAAVKALSDGAATLEVRLCQLVKFTRGGEPVKMSKRKGTFMTVRDVVDEVGNGVFRFIMLTRKNDAALDFDFEKVMEQTRDNPVFYVQYAHARAKSVLRLAESEAPEALAASVKPTQAILAKLEQAVELECIRLLGAWPRQVEAAALAYGPHRIAFYLQEVAAAFHGLWNKGNSDYGLRFLQKDDIELTAARLALVRSLALVIATGLQTLGIEAVEEMR